MTIHLLLRNESLRNWISRSQKAFFAAEMQRAEGHVRVEMKRALDAAAAMRAVAAPGGST